MMQRHVRSLAGAVLAAALATGGVGPPGVRYPAAPEPARAAEPSDLDPSFGVGGKVTTPIGAGGAIAAIAVQADGKIVAAGHSDYRWTLARYGPDGALDAGFDGDGVVSTEVAGWSGHARAVAIQGDGKIVAAGETSFNGGYCCRLAIVRYNADGSLDSSFDGDGTLLSEIAFYAAGVAIQDDGRIVVAGTWDGWPERGFIVARFNSDGTPDTSFGVDGAFEVSFGSLEAVVEGMALAPDGKIVVVGSYGSTFGGATVDIAIARLNADGSLDATLGGDGTVTTTIDGTEGRARAVAVHPDGTIVVAGSSRLLRYSADGSLDPGFGDGGVAMIPNATWGYGLALQPDGRVIVAWGGYFGSDDPDVAVGRFDADGELDALSVTDFGEGAARTTDIAEAVAIQADGKIVAAGSGGTWCSNCRWALARYTALRPNLRLVATPPSVDFGVVVAGTLGTATVDVSNPSSSSSVLIDSVSMGDGTPSSISIASQDCPLAALAPKTSCSVTLQFAPTVAATVTGQLEIRSNAISSPLLIPISGTGKLPPSGVTWGSTYKAGPAYTWNAGNALARTVQSGTQRLHLAYGTYRIGSSWAKDTGPYAGVYYTRSTSGSTWSTPKRLNPTNQHAARLGLAAAGSRVYATWVSQTKVVRYSATAPRVLYVRVNTSHGASSSWKSAIRLTSTSGRVDYPTIAAYGYDVHVAWTDAVTGSVKVASSRDRGVTWKRLSLGSTSLYDRSGKFGLPAVAVAGSTVAVAWLADRYGTVNARVSTNRGVSWGPTVTVGTQSASSVSVAVRGSRIAVAWVTATDVVVSQRIAGVWGEAVVAGSLTPTPDDPVLYGPAVFLQDPQRVAVAWTEGLDSEPLRSNLMWAESANGGATWFAAQRIATTASSRRLNDFPSIVWPTAITRYVAWNGWNPYSTTYRLYLRKGTGAPVGPTSVAPAWVPAADPPLIVPDADGGIAPLIGPNERRAVAPTTE